MEGPKYRRLILIALVLLAGGALLLIDRPRPAPQPASATMTMTHRQVELKQPVEVESPILEAAAPPVQPPSASTPQHGFRGRVIDAVSRQPIKEFEVQLIRVRREARTEDQPITRNFKSASGHFAWTDVATGTWRAAVSAPGYQMFNVDARQITEGEATSEIVMPLLRGFAVRGRVVESSTGAGISGARSKLRLRRCGSTVRSSLPTSRRRSLR